MDSIFKETIEYLRDYYLDWNDYIERFSFPRLDYYYLLINISSYYKMLDRASHYLDKCNDEIDLIYTLIFIPRKSTFNDSIYNNIKSIRSSLEYNNLVLEKYKED